MRDDMMTTLDVAKYLRISERTVQRLADSGSIPGALRVGHQWRFDRKTFIEFACNGDNGGTGGSNATIAG